MLPTLTRMRNLSDHLDLRHCNLVKKLASIVQSYSDELKTLIYQDSHRQRLSKILLSLAIILLNWDKADYDVTIVKKLIDQS